MSALGSQEDAYRPSLFELDAQQKLRELLQPAVQYAVAVSHSSPIRPLTTSPHTHLYIHPMIDLCTTLSTTPYSSCEPS